MSEKIKGRTYTLPEVAQMIGLGLTAAKKHIKTAFPEFYEKGKYGNKYKAWFSESEVKLIREEFLSE